MQHFGDTSGYDAAGIALINSSINADVAPADPTGVIGATMTASHGGLMLGGAGNNSFIATGPGDYEMIGGPWINTFNISPSFDGVPATYEIDGGPFGQSQLVVRVPADENVTFENSHGARQVQSVAQGAWPSTGTPGYRRRRMEFKPCISWALRARMSPSATRRKSISPFRSPAALI